MPSDAFDRLDASSDRLEERLQARREGLAVLRKLGQFTLTAAELVAVLALEAAIRGALKEGK